MLERRETMKVLMYGWELPPNISGGLGVACHGIIDGLLKNGCEVTIILPNDSEVSPDLFHNHEKLRVITTKFIHGSVSAYFSIYKNKLIEIIEKYAKFSSKFAKTIPHDVIHVHDWLTVLAGVTAKKISQKALIFHIHSLEVERSKNIHNKKAFQLEKYGMEQADHILTVSELTKKNIIKHYGIPAAKISVAHNGLFETQIQKDLPIQHSELQTKTALFLGRITHQKGPFYFIKAAEKILKKRKDIRFIIAGDGDLYKKVVKKVADLKLESYIHFTKFLNREEVQLAYQSSQVYVMPSISEPFGLTCLEALGQGVPVICSKQSGVSEVVHNMITVNYWDVDKMAMEIENILDSPKLRDDIIIKILPELSQLLWDNTADKIKTVYKTIMKK